MHKFENNSDAGRPSAGDDRERRAAEWFALLIDPATTDHDRLAFRLWLQESEANARAYADLERLWSGAGLLPELAARKTTRRRIMTGGAAAVLLTGGAVYGGLRQADYRTATGQTADVRLADGSRLTLSTASALDVAFGAGRRQIILRGGEVYAEVAPDPARPFVVQAGDTHVTALGTAFSVRMDAGGVDVAVAEHAVSVTCGAEERRVEEGQAVLARNGRIARLADADMETRFSWRNGRLVFVSRPFAAVAAELQRWHPGRIIVMDDNLARRPVTLIVEVRRAADIPSMLRETLGLRVETYSPWLTLVYAS